jgi:hypothetical protein
VFFTGAESQRKRTQSVVEFHDEPSAAVMLLSDAGGVGLNLQRAASCCINLELPWNPAVLEQRISRIYRIGQRRPIDVYNLVSEGGIEERIALAVAGKQALFTSVFDGTSNEVRFDASESMLGQLERLIEPVEVPELEAEADGDLAATNGQSEIDRVVSAADEAGDAPAIDRGQVATAEAAATSGADRESAHRAVTPERAAEPTGLAMVPQQQIQQMVASLSVRRTAAGGVTIEAPPETAATLATLFGAMAQMLAQQATAAPHAPR